MVNENSVEEKIHLHIQLWAHYNLVYWILLVVSIFGLIISGSMVFMVYLMGRSLIIVEIIITAIYFLFSVISYILFKITAKMHSYRLYEKQRIAELKKESVKDYLPPINDLDISRFGKIQGFVTSSTLFYMFIMTFLLSSVTVFMTMIFSKNAPWVPYIVFLVLLGFAVLLFIPWIQMAKNWGLRKRK